MRASVVGWVCGLSGLAVGVVLGATLGARSGADAPQATPGPVEVERGAGPTRAVEETGAGGPPREALEAEVARLRAALEAATAAAPAAAATPMDPEAAQEESAEPPQDGFDEDALREAGYAEGEIARLREQWDAYELERLYRSDEARREGWLHSERFRRENRQRYAELRAALGEDDFDAMLYAAGQHNRVAVIDVLQGSVAEQAGLQSEDRIVEYDGERIFDMQGLVQATGEGEPGRTVEVRFRRDGQERRVFLPAGPIGVRVRPDRQPPDRGF